MDRRTFVSAVTLGLLAAPLAAEAQQAGKVSRVGVLVTANPRLYDGFVDELHRLGYVDGQNVVLDFRNAEGQYERFPALAAELVRAGVDVILAGGGAAPFRAARQATPTIPVVIVAIDYDPLALKFVANLARPGGNVTGVFLQQIELTAKRMELLKALLPKTDTAVHLVGSLRRGPGQDCGSCVTVPGYPRPIAGDQKSFRRSPRRIRDGGQRPRRCALRRHNGGLLPRARADRPARRES